MIFETERLIIRGWTDQAADLERIFDIYRRSEVTRWLGMDEPLSEPAQAQATADRWQAYYAEYPARYGGWAVQRRDTGVVAGTVLLKPMPEPSDGVNRDAVEVGWHFHLKQPGPGETKRPG